jgi:NAD(P)-dependent dehydrogenase (short-subunit alcohol dehydrogenase family)
MPSIDGKIVYLTGATHGIGRAIAVRLAREKVSLALCGRDAGAMGEVERAAKDAGARALHTKTFDMRDEDGILAFYRESRSRLGPPSIVICNAGYNSRKASLWEVTTEEFDGLIAVNLRAPFILIREAFPDLKAAGGGHVIVVLSTCCRFDMETMGAYTAAKNGLEGLVDVFRKEARPHDIRVTSVYPGGTDTRFRKTPRPEYLRPESVAEAVAQALLLPEDLVMHELVFRPMVETNF